MKTKTCYECNEEKEINLFKSKTSKYFLKNGEEKIKHYFLNLCLECNKKRQKKSYLKHRKKRLIEKKEYYLKNKEEILKYHQSEEYYNKRKIYKDKNRDKIRKTDRRYIKNNPKARLIAMQRTRIRDALRKTKTKKNSSTIELLGCSSIFLKEYLESKFKEGMSWHNYGIWKRNGPLTWHVDHIKPCSSFDLTDEEQQKICFHYTNLQPLWANENLSKWNK